ncbi:ATP-binding cassette domain-containing protein [Streptomyces rhizosphaericus]|uniref:ATP-binding cassette domain-containing protein n=1 Tax=Streptomyces rhizosphaericus TaxID=114699 RepID=UPI0036447683
MRLYGIGAFLQGRMLADRRATNSARRNLDRREALVQSGLALFAALVSGGGLLWAVISARSGHLSLGDITIFIAAVAGVQSSLVAVAGHLSSSHQALMMFDHYRAVITAGADLPVAASPRPLPALRRGIEFRDVWFRYSEEHPWVLAGVNLSIPHGKALALVGLNGSGKSTLVKLICRFYDPTRGAILWDGVDLRARRATRRGAGGRGGADGEEGAVDPAPFPPGHRAGARGEAALVHQADSRHARRPGAAGGSGPS